MKHIRKNTTERPLKRFKELLDFAVSRYIKNPPQGSVYDLPGILGSDLKALLPEGTGHCLCCGKALREDEVGYLAILDGRYHFCCRSTVCRESLKGSF